MERATVRGMVMVGLLLAGLSGGCRQQAPVAASATPAVGRSRTALPAVARTPRSRQLTRYARLVAGVDDPDAAPGDALRAAETYRIHAREMTALWSHYESIASTKIRPWAEKSLAAVPDAPTLFYPFGGADLLFPTTFFPKARTYVLVGLERVGVPADLETLSAAKLEALYGRARKAMTPLLKSSFFVTLDMQSDVYAEGVVSVLEALLAGAGDRLVETSLVSVGGDGTLKPRESAETTHAKPGVRIDFVKDGETDVRSVYYFRMDISDKGLSSLGGLLPFVDTLGPKVTFVKAASYCMHGSDFSMIRNYVLNNSLAILQDDTGVPYRYLDAAHWDVRYFGLYTKPIPSFQRFRQPALAEAFARRENVGPLDFRIGYGDSMASSLMLAIKRATSLPAR